MHCNYAQELFSDYIEGNMERALAVSVENHLNGCASCQTEVQQLRSLWGALDIMPREETPAFLHENIMSRITQEQNAVEETKTRRRALWDWRTLFQARGFAMGAAALLVVLMGAEVVQTQRASLGPLSWLVQMVRPGAPMPGLETQSAMWVPDSNAAQGGSLVVNLKTKPLANGMVNLLKFQIVEEGQEKPLYEGVVASNRETTVRIPMNATPSNGKLQLILKTDDDTPKMVGEPISLTVSGSEVK